MLNSSMDVRETVCLYSDCDAIQAVYAHDIAEFYRFYSYGDSSLLLPE